MKHFLIHATITGETQNFRNVNGEIAKDKDEVTFRPKAKNASNAVRSARTFAHYVGCKIYQVVSVEEIN